MHSAKLLGAPVHDFRKCLDAAGVVMSQAPRDVVWNFFGIYLLRRWYSFVSFFCLFSVPVRCSMSRFRRLCLTSGSGLNIRILRIFGCDSLRLANWPRDTARPYGLRVSSFLTPRVKRAYSD